MATTYTVKWGDTLSELAVKYNTTVNALVKLNNIADPDYIVVGQKLIISGTATSVQKNTSSKAKITTFGLQTGTTNVVYAAWSWDKSNTNNYQLKWEYNTGDGIWFEGNSSTVTIKQSTYSAPSNALSVRFRVKPISKTKTVNNKETSYWTASWSDAKSYSFSKNPPTTPSAPSVSIDGTKLTASLSNLGSTNASIIQFDVAKNDSASFKLGKVKVTETDSATYECTVELGSVYKVRARSIKSEVESDWSSWSSEVNTVPSAPTIKACKTDGTDDNPTVVVEWDEIKAATSYLVQYSTIKADFSSDTPEALKDVTVEAPSCTISGVTVGTEYFVRVRASNSVGDSEWSSISSTVTDEDVSAPTTWSSTVTAIVGDPLTLYWMHNSESGSDATYADLELYSNGAKIVTKTLDYTSEDGSVDTEDTKTYTIDTSEYDEGTRLQWRVRTAGANKTFGSWSILRTVNIYARPELELIVTDFENNAYTSEEGSSFTLSSFPIYITASAGPDLQEAISYHVTITSNEEYETVDNIGNTDIVTEGEKVYSRYFDTLDEYATNAFSLTISAGDVNLEPNISYTITCSVTMNSGLSAEASLDFLTSWEDTEYFVNAEVIVDRNNFTASVGPYCLDENNKHVDNMLLFVYRREFDGSFTKLGSDIVNGTHTFVTDPHPALDYARYRIVAMNTETGAISYNDIPGVHVGGTAIVIQWDEEWSVFDATGGEFEEPSWSGSLLKLPYNVDVSDKHSPDISLIEYIGREYPVSYYGTQLGKSATWSVSVDKSDKETLYALRRLARWMGNAYVREPSGSGYWASLTVSFSQKHRELTIPVTIEVVRVEGGA